MLTHLPMASMSLTMACSLTYLLVILLSSVPFSAGLAVMSIDFGNEFMKIAIVKPGVPMEIVLNKESRRKTPTTIHLKDGERLVGDPAVTAAIRYPKYGYRYLLDVLGKHYDNPLVQLYKTRFPHNNLIKDEETGMVLFKHDEDVLFSPEELIAMMLQKAKDYAETFAEQTINEAVITVPSYFNQAERRAMYRAAETAGLRILQLINDNTAVALNYGVFRHKVFNSTALNYMFFDIGATGTTATVVAYQVVKNPQSSADTYPQLTIKGIGFDRTLGGVEFQLRLRDYLAQQFSSVKRTKKDVTTDARAMQKLFKEAGRVKQVLSANTDHFAQVESLFEDEDFRTKVTREQFEGLCQDLVDRIDKVIKDALARAELSVDDIEEVILMGGGTRIPKVQEAIKSAIGREELGKGINTDEAAALGAVYQAANLGKGFKVKKFGIKDATVYPIKVEFERARLKEADSSSAAESTSKTVRRVLFGHMQPYPQKKVITFNKHVEDFTFDVRYGDLDFLSPSELSEFGSTHLQTVSLAGVADAYTQHSDAEPKGIKAHFRVDDSGLLYLDKVEAQFEKTTTEEVEVAEESTLSKIGSTISNLFGGGSKTEEAGEASSEGSPEEAVPEVSAEAETETSKKSDDSATSESKEDKSGDTDKAKANDTVNTDKKSAESEEKKTEVKTKTTTLRANITWQATVRDLPNPTEQKLKQSKKLIAELKKLEEEKHLLDKVKNEIESFIFDAQDRLEQRDYKLCSTEDERVSISTKLSEASDWLIEQEDSTPRKEYESKLNELKEVTKDVYDRVSELHERPTAIAALNSMMNHSEFFLSFMRNFTGEDMPFTQVEFDVLDKMVNETREWNKSMHALQAKTPLTEKPKFTIEDVAMKIVALDREVKYLVNKMKSYRPKTKPKPTKESNTTDNSSNETKILHEEFRSPDDKTKETKDELDQDILENVATDEAKTSSGTENKEHNHEPDDEL